MWRQKWAALRVRRHGSLHTSWSNRIADSQQGEEYTSKAQAAILRIHCGTKVYQSHTRLQCQASCSFQRGALADEQGINGQEIRQPFQRAAAFSPCLSSDGSTIICITSREKSITTVTEQIARGASTAK